MRRVILAIVLIAACSHRTPDPQTVASWAATLQMTAESWLNNSVPSSFARSTIDAAMKSFENDDKLKAAAQDFRQAIDRNDRRKVAECARRFAEAKK